MRVFYMIEITFLCLCIIMKICFFLVFLFLGILLCFGKEFESVELIFVIWLVENMGVFMVVFIIMLLFLICFFLSFVKLELLKLDFLFLLVIYLLNVGFLVFIFLILFFLNHVFMLFVMWLRKFLVMVSKFMKSLILLLVRLIVEWKSFLDGVLNLELVMIILWNIGEIFIRLIAV